MDFRDIKTLPRSNYKVDIAWSWGSDCGVGGLKGQIDEYIKQGLNMDPDFQRGYVWTMRQKIDFVEWGLIGGSSGMAIYFNHPGWMNSWDGDFVLVDGKQRIDAVLGFLNNKVKAFGRLFKDFSGKMDPLTARFAFHICDLRTKREVLEWYIMMNTGGTQHQPEEIEKVKMLIKNEM